MKNIKYILLIFVSMTFLSCNDDFLELTPQDKLNSGDVWKDIVLVELLVNDMYGSLPDGFNRGWAMLGSATDDGENGYGWPALQRFNIGAVSPSNYPFGGTWANNYRVIRSANDLIANVDGVENANEAQLNRIKGEAYFLRAFYYFDLARHYGGVPIIETAQSLDDDLLTARNTYDETVDFIVSDLDKIISGNLLPTNHDSGNVGRATIGAAMALKGRILLYAERWAASAAASKGVMDANTYSLFSDYESLFVEANENNDEVIFDKQFQDPDLGHWGHLFNHPVGYPGGWGGTNPTQELVDTYEMTDGELPATSGLYDANDPYVNRDPRFAATVLYNGTNYRGRAVETNLGGLDGIEKNGDATKTGYYLRKFMDESFVEYSAVTGSNNWIHIRYAEVLLNYAEAQNEVGGPDANVYSAINEVRSRASVNMPDLPAGLSQDEMRERIRRERRIELAFEEHRFFDVRRWGIGEQVFSGAIHGIRIGPNGELTGASADDRPYGLIEVESRTFLPAHTLAPIPQSEIDKNPKLNQNTGY
ncbi:MAG: hypothetical protein ACJA2S_003876 [Cyclobacteriaceae bacterium]|jgi:hypothetical protein